MERHGSQKKKILVVTVLAVAVVLLALTELLVGSSGMSVRSCVLALLGQGDTAAVRIMRYIRLPRLLAAVIAGAGLSAAGLVMQTVLGDGEALAEAENQLRGRLRRRADGAASVFHRQPARQSRLPRTARKGRP